MHGSELQSRRRRLGLTQTQLAAALGVKQATISRWEAGVMPIEHPAMLRLALQHIDQEQLQRGDDERVAAVEQAAQEMQRRIDQEARTPSPERDAADRWFGPH